MTPDIRRKENTHILLWLIKDTCWISGWKELGMAMILPTVGLALLIAWKSRRNRAEFVHNLAVVFWISGNGFWMTGEFFNREDALKQVGVLLFATGLFPLLSYYAWRFLRAFQIKP